MPETQDQVGWSYSSKRRGESSENAKRWDLEKSFYVKKKTNKTD